MLKTWTCRYGLYNKWFCYVCRKIVPHKGVYNSPESHLFGKDPNKAKQKNSELGQFNNIINQRGYMGVRSRGRDVQRTI